MLSELGEDARLLAGGQSLIPLMKLRLARPRHLVDVNFIPSLAYTRQSNGSFEIGALARHAQIAESEAARTIPILHDCAAGIADVQVRNWGTMAGSLAEADPTGDWAPVLLALDAELHCVGTKARRVVPLPGFIKDAFVTDLGPHEVIQQVVIKTPAPGSGGAFVAFKRCAPVYATVAVAVQLTLAEGVCSAARIFLGAVGMTAVNAVDAARQLKGARIAAATVQRSAEAAMAEAQPESDARGAVEFKRAMIGSLVKEAIGVAARRAGGEHVEVSHHYA
jgi:carbon-monoxide dehydrogenase medium subunit